MPKGKWRMSKRERALLGLIAFSFAIAFYKLGYVRHSKETEQLSVRLEQAKSHLKDRESIVRDLQAKSTAVRVSTPAGEYSKYLEASKYLSTLLKKLGAGDSNNGIKLNIINIENHARVDDFYRSTFKLEIESSFIELGRFLEVLGTSEALIEVKSVQLNRIDNDLKRCHATIEVNGYYQAERG